MANPSKFVLFVKSFIIGKYFMLSKRFCLIDYAISLFRVSGSVDQYGRRLGTLQFPDKSKSAIKSLISSGDITKLWSPL